MSDLSLNTVSFQPTQQVQQTQPTQPPAPPQPPKGQSDHKPLNTSDSSRGPAVVLSGALAQGTGSKRDASGAQGSSQGASQSSSQSSSQGGSSPQQASTQATGQHVNHVI